jgi:hypothetical protein
MKMKLRKSLALAFIVLCSFGSANAQGIRVDIPDSAKYVSYVGNDAYYLTDDEKYFLIKRGKNPSLLFETQTGRLAATGAEAYRLYAENTTVLSAGGFREEKTATSVKVYENDKEVNSLKIGRGLDGSWVKGTNMIVAFDKGKRKATIILPGGKEISLIKNYSNLDRKDPKREIDHSTLAFNLNIGYAYVTPDFKYSLDRDGRLINLETGDVQKLNYSARNSHGYVYATYSPETSILKVNETGDVQAYHLRTGHYFGEVDYSYYLDNEYIYPGPVVIPLQRSNSQLCIMGLGYETAKVCLITDGKVLHYFNNPNVETEKTNFELALQKQREENAERLRQEEAKREWNRKYLASGPTLKQCTACNGKGIRGYTEANASNKRYVYEERNGSHYFKGTSHDTWPIICGTCIGRGSVLK